MDNLAVLFEPFSFTFMQQAFAIVLLVAVPTSILSCFLVLKGWSLMGCHIAFSFTGCHSGLYSWNSACYWGFCCRHGLCYRDRLYL